MAALSPWVAIYNCACSATIEAGAAVSGSGGALINLNGATLTIQNGAMVQVPIVNQGTLVLGASPGQITLPSYTQTEMGTLEIELGGTGANEIDRLIVTGQAFIAGTLNLSLIDDFVPSGGETFDFLAAAGGISGAFDTINLPSLPLGLFWSFNNDNPTMFQLFVMDSLPGDYNLDNTVDAADYVVWRKTGINGPQGYIDWRSHFGQTAMGSGAEAIASAAVPEPAALVFMSLAAACGYLQRRRAA